MNDRAFFGINIINNLFLMNHDYTIMEAAKINIPINFQQLIEAVKQLSPKEKLKLNELIWDDNGAIPIEHQELVLDRIKEARKDPAKMLDWDEVEKTL